MLQRPAPSNKAILSLNLSLSPHFSSKICVCFYTEKFFFLSEITAIERNIYIHAYIFFRTIAPFTPSANKKTQKIPPP